MNHKLSSLKDKIKAAKEEKKKKREAGEKKVAVVEEDDLLQVKRRDADDEDEEEEEEMVVPKRRKGEKGKRIVFDEDGNTGKWHLSGHHVKFQHITFTGWISLFT